MSKPVLAPHVYGVLGAVNAYLIDCPESGLVMIDAGLPGRAKKLLELIQQMGRSPQDVKYILITHADVDHVGGLTPLADATGASVYAGQETAKYIQLCQSPPHVAFPMNLLVGTMNHLFRKPVPVQHIVQDNELLDIAGGIRAIATPGHTHDHFSYFWEREGILFGGDLLDNDRGLEVSRRSVWNKTELEKSARRVMALEPKAICVGHGEIWREAEHPDQLLALKNQLTEG